MKLILIFLAMTSSLVAEHASIVAIRSTGKPQCTVDAFGRKTCVKVVGTGTGVVVDRASFVETSQRGVLVVTAKHVVRDGISFEVSMRGRMWPARLVASDDDSDLALLAAPCDEQTIQSMIPVDLADSDPRGPEPVTLLGYSGGVDGGPPQESTGTIEGAVDADNHRPVHMESTLQLGQSGGPFLDCEGRLVGILSQRRESDMRHGFGVPVSRVREVLRLKWRVIPPRKQAPPPPLPPEPPLATPIRKGDSGPIGPAGPKGDAGSNGLAGPQGERGPAPSESAIAEAVKIYLRSNPALVTIVIEDNGKQVFSKSDVPTGSVVRVPITRTQKTDAR